MRHLRGSRRCDVAYADDLAEAVQLLRAAAMGGTAGADVVARQLPDERLRPVLVQLAWLAGRRQPMELAEVDSLELELSWLLSPDR